MATEEQMEQIAQLMAQLEVMSKNMTDMQAALATHSLDNAEAFNHTWLLVCGFLVMLMQAGFALLEAGMCREKNAQSVLMKNVLDCCVGTVAWFALGWALAYGNVPEDGFAGSEQFFTSQFLSKGFTVEGSPNSLFLDWFFQWAFCNTACTIVSGGVAERMHLGGYIIFAFVMTGIIYPVVVAWTWSGSGWLASVGAGYLDFAGSGIVHLTGGIGALVGAMILGKRHGRFEGDQSEFDPHNATFVVLGTMILWFGWYGFNCGSTLAMDGASGKTAALVATNTTIAASVGGLQAALVAYLTSGKWDLMAACGGILAGLVSITANCGNVTPVSAFFIGIIGSTLYFFASKQLKKMGVDDPIDAFAVHGVCGYWGTIAVSLFDWAVWEEGGFSVDPEQYGVGDSLGANIAGLLAITAWSGGLCSVTFFALKQAGWLRVEEFVERRGMDATEFASPKAYNVSTWPAAKPVDVVNPRSEF